MILWEGDPTDPTRKPPEMYTLIENFCLGLRRLELFARARSLRRGWVSVLAEGEETNIPAVQAQARAGDVQLPLAPEQQLGAGTNVLGQELSVDRAERWDHDKWEAALRGWLQNGRVVVPMTPGTFLTYKADFLLGLTYMWCEQRSTHYGQSRPCAVVVVVAVVAAAAATRRTCSPGACKTIIISPCPEEEEHPR